MIAALTLASDDAAGRAAHAACLARGNQPPTAFDRAQCDEVIASGMVGGRYCEGSVSMTVDSAGIKQRVCIPRSVVDAKVEAIKNSPLPPPRVEVPMSVGAKVAIGVAIGLAAYFALR